MQNEKVIIIGAGLAGSLLSIYLAKRGIQVEIYEARGDMRSEEVSAGRSINLALSDRGIAALREIGMDEYMLSEAVPMYGRMVHTKEGETRLLRYSGREGEYINSVSRSGLNIALINEAEKQDEVTLHFNEKCIGFDCRTGEAAFSSGDMVGGGTVIATDGAGSQVRHAMMNGGVERFNFSQQWLEHGYKELHIPAAADGSFQLEKNALHIWPRDKFMMIALPNFDGSFTCTLFAAHHGENSFDEITNGPADRIRGDWPAGSPQGDREESSVGNVMDFFHREFPDVVPLMPTLLQDYYRNPVGNLGTVKCFPWNAGGKALLLGDSAHAVVPFYGQGMNCAFEDVRVLDELIGKLGINWERVYAEYGDVRKPNTDAIADMAEENFYEMRDAVADPVFLRKRQLETKLEHAFPDYFSKYSMVTFREDLPYSEAHERGNAQDTLLMSLCREVEDVESLDLEQVMKKVRGLN
jgi:kynurenine 3-monooxygenase